MYSLGLLAVVTTLDGILTYIGLTHYGQSEGNPFIEWLMGMIGVVPALVSTRILAVYMGYVIAFSCRRPDILMALSLVMFIITVVPWVFFILKAAL